jgi:HK97 family phage major capsid protein
MNPTDLREAVEYLDACLRDLVEDPEGNLRTLDPEAQTRFDEGLALRRQYAADLDNHAEIARLAPITGVPGDQRGAPQVNFNRDPMDVAQDRTASAVQLRDAAMKAVEARVEDPANLEHVQKLLGKLVPRTASRADQQWARETIERTSDEYEVAWSKWFTGRSELMDNEERVALTVGSSTNGGYLLPTHLDPTIILTNAGSSNDLRRYARVVTLANGANTWNGVTSAGVTASWDGELVEVSDDTPTFGRVSITPGLAQAFVQASIPAFEDIAGLQNDVMMMFADAKDRLEGAAFATGTGTPPTPKGVWTAVHAVSAGRVTSTTAATIGLVDLNAMYVALGHRWRSKAAWMMNPTYAVAIKSLGTAISASYSGDLRDPTASRILGHPVVESDDAPTTQTTTALDDEVIFGDFSQFVIVDKPGMGVDFIPHLFNTANNLPDGRRGWYSWWRTGADITNASAFVVLVDKTSA